MQTYTRTASLFEGVQTLVEADLPLEAVILGRELFTDSLHLMELAAQSPDDQKALVMGARNGLLSAWENVVHEALTCGEETEAGAAEVLAVVQEQRRGIEVYRKKHGVGRLRRFRHEKQLARELGRGTECLHFELAHLMVHRADFVQPMRTSKKEDVRMLHLRGGDPEMLVAAAAFAMRSAVHAHKAAASILGWLSESEEDSHVLLEEVEALES